jgi:MFS family permease
MTPSISPRRVWTIAVLLGLVTFINFADRGNLATAAALIKRDLHLSATQYGWLVSGFFAAYAPANFIAGWLAEKFDPYRTLAIGLLIWALATGLMGAAGSFGFLLLLRVLLGLGESVSYPCASLIFSRLTPASRRGLANGLIAAGSALGAAVGVWIGGRLMAAFGWQPVFIGFGCISLIWLAPWLWATRGLAASRSHPAGPDLISLLRQRGLWAAGAGQFCYAYNLYFVLTWLPLYLVKAKGLSMAQMADLTGLIYLVYAVSGPLMGALVDRLVASGMGEGVARRGAMMLALGGMLLAMLGCAQAGLSLFVALMLVTVVCVGTCSSSTFAIGQTMAGPGAAGRWMGVQNGLANFSGILGPPITGAIVDATGAYTGAFVAAAAIAGLGVIVWWRLVPEIKPVVWSARPA